MKANSIFRLGYQTYLPQLGHRASQNHGNPFHIAISSAPYG